MDTAERLKLIRDIIKNGVVLQIQYHENNILGSAKFIYDHDISVLHNNAKNILKMLRDNHNISILHLYNNALKLPENSILEIKWDDGLPDEDFFTEMKLDKIKNGEWDYDENIDARPNLDLDINKDLRVDIMQFNDLAKLPSWVIDQLNEEHIIMACANKRLDLIKFIYSKINYIPSICYSFAIKNEDTLTINYLLAERVEFDDSIFDGVENWSNESWSIFKEIYNETIKIPSRVLGLVVDSNERFEWFLKNKAPRKFGIMQCIKNNKQDLLNILLCYSREHEFNGDLTEAFAIMLSLNSLPFIEGIYKVLIDNCLFSVKLDLTVINNQSKYNLFKKCLEYIPYYKFYEIINPYPQFIEYDASLFEHFAYKDIDNTMRYCRNNKEAIQKCFDFITFSGKDIQSEQHKIMMYPVHNYIKYAYEVGFRVLRSFYRDITYTDAKYLFKVCNELSINIIEDVPEDEWNEQVKRFNMPTIDIPQILVKKNNIRVQIYDTKEIRDNEGFWNPVCLYDIIGCSVDKYKMDHSGKLVIYMRGINSGEMADREHPLYDTKWIEEDEFILKHEYTNKITQFFHKRANIGDYYIRLN